MTDPYPWRSKPITGHYRWANIVNIEEWALAEMKAMRAADDRYSWHPGDREAAGVVLSEQERYDKLDELATWCGWWVEQDPGDNGGDGSYRRGMRPHWPKMYALYRTLRG